MNSRYDKEKIRYTYLDENRVQRYGEWVGDSSTAIRAAVERLNAVLLKDGNYRYHADEVGRDYLITTEEMASLGAAILSGHEDFDTYSLWCAECGEECG